MLLLNDIFQDFGGKRYELVYFKVLLYPSRPYVTIRKIIGS